MLKWLLGLLVLANLLVWVVMKWGGLLMTETENPSVQAELHADKIKLASELPITVSPAVLPVPSLLPVTSELDKSVCYQWGGLVADDIDRAQKILAEAELPNKLNQHQLTQPSGYWVFMGPLKSREQVRVALVQLKALGVTDYYPLLDEGTSQYSISLGVFKTEVAAQVYLAKLKDKGVENIQFGQHEKAADVVTITLGPLVVGVLAKLDILRKNFPNSQLQEISCPVK